MPATRVAYRCPPPEHFTGHTAALPGFKALISVSGRLDHHSASRLRQEIAKPLAATLVSLVIDLSRITFMDSSALRVLAAE